MSYLIRISLCHRQSKRKKQGRFVFFFSFGYVTRSLFDCNNKKPLLLFCFGWHTICIWKTNNRSSMELKELTDRHYSKESMERDWISSNFIQPKVFLKKKKKFLAGSSNCLSFLTSMWRTRIFMSSRRQSKNFEGVSYILTEWSLARNKKGNISSWTCLTNGSTRLQYREKTKLCDA